jgi:NAD+ diphosphatase|tara:strand:+ start:499 stop:1326 length:828 start_codon:yes stop_codon:yes gene_type:complete
MIIHNNNLIFIPENVNSKALIKEFIVLKGQEFLTNKEGHIVFLNEDDIKWSGMESDQHHFLGYLNDKSLFIVELKDESMLMEDTILSSLRVLLGAIPDNLFSICSRSLQIVEWFNSHRYCGRCGSKMNSHAQERGMQCECTKILTYPRISPCVIVLVTNGDYLLLAHNKNFPGSFYSTLAGFIEAGENAEDAIHREILEEVSIEVKNITYFGTQSWPFPSQLMIGYHAEFLKGDIRPDGIEIDEAKWFHKDEMPSVPSGKISISGKLIEDYLGRI